MVKSVVKLMLLGLTIIVFLLIITAPKSYNEYDLNKDGVVDEYDYEMMVDYLIKNGIFELNEKYK